MRKTAVIRVRLLIMAAIFIFLPAGCTNGAPDSPSQTPYSAEQGENNTLLSEPADTTHQAIGLDEEGLVFATLAGMDIKAGEFLFFRSVMKERLLHDMGIQPGSADEDLFWRSEVSDGVTTAEHVMALVLDELARFKMMSLYVEENGSVDNETRLDIRSYLIAMADEFGGSEAFTAHIEQTHGISRVLFLDLFEQSLMQEMFFNEALNNIVIDEAAARAEYEHSIAAYEVVTVRHILFFDEERGREASRRLADDMRRRVESGEDMAVLARTYSEDPWADGNSGVYTFSRFDEFDPEFIEWSFEADIGDVGLVETRLGVHVVRLEEQSVEPFDHVKDSILHYLRELEMRERMDQWFSQPRFLAFDLDRELLARMAW